MMASAMTDCLRALYDGSDSLTRYNPRLPLELTKQPSGRPKA